MDESAARERLYHQVSVQIFARTKQFERRKPLKKNEGKNVNGGGDWGGEQKGSLIEQTRRGTYERKEKPPTPRDL